MIDQQLYTKRQIADHKQYMAHREERKAKQRAYYLANREYYIEYMTKRRKEAYANIT